MSPPDQASLAPALRAARDAAVVCDLSPLSVLAVTGADAGTFLHGQLSSDVTGLAEGAACYTSFNSPKGRMLANFVLWREGQAAYQALLPGDIAETVRKRLSMYVLRSKVALLDVSAATIRVGIGGPQAAAALQAALGMVPQTMAVVRDGDVRVIGLPGPRFVVLAPAGRVSTALEPLARHAVRAPHAAWQWLTVRAGIPVVTAPVQDQFVAQMANWDVLGGLDFAKGCYTGQEIIARMQYLGRLKERLFAFHTDAEGVLAGTRVYGPAFGDQACGTVVNAAAAPDGGSDLLAVVQLAAVEAGALRLDTPDGPALAPLPLPYSVPPPAPPRGRIGTPA
jgi:folate-binding protein YgfZ